MLGLDLRELKCQGLILARGEVLESMNFPVLKLALKHIIQVLHFELVLL